MESCFSVKEPLRGIRDTGMRTDWLMTGLGSHGQHQSREHKYLDTCKVSLILALSNIFCVMLANLKVM